MHTRMGTEVLKVHEVDPEGYCECDLKFDGEISRREIHVSDLRFANDSESGEVYGMLELARQQHTA